MMQQMEKLKLENKKLELQLALKTQEEENRKLAQLLSQLGKESEKDKSNSLFSSATTYGTEGYNAWKEQQDAPYRAAEENARQAREKEKAEQEKAIIEHFGKLGLPQNDQNKNLCSLYYHGNNKTLPAFAIMQSLETVAARLNELKIPITSYDKIRHAEICYKNCPQFTPDHMMAVNWLERRGTIKPNQDQVNKTISEIKQNKQSYDILIKAVFDIHQ